MGKGLKMNDMEIIKECKHLHNEHVEELIKLYENMKMQYILLIDEHAKQTVQYKDIKEKYQKIKDKEFFEKMNKYTTETKRSD